MTFGRPKKVGSPALSLSCDAWLTSLLPHAVPDMRQIIGQLHNVSSRIDAIDASTPKNQEIFVKALFILLDLVHRLPAFGNEASSVGRFLVSEAEAKANGPEAGGLWPFGLVPFFGFYSSILHDLARHLNKRAKELGTDENGAPTPNVARILDYVQTIATSCSYPHFRNAVESESKHP